MGHIIITGTLEALPQTGAVVPSAASNVISAASEGQREVVRCLDCSLVQFRTHDNQCRRCHAGLDAPPPPRLAAPEPELDAAIETAEATGTESPDVAGAVRQWRLRRGLSQRQLAERMRVPRTYVSKIENDKAMPTLGSLDRMATAMETNIATLLECAGGGAPSNPTDYAVRDLAKDGFIRELMALLPRLEPAHMAQLLGESRGRGQRAPR